MTKAPRNLAQRVADRLQANALVVIVQESDEVLAAIHVKAAAEAACSPVEILSVTTPGAIEKLTGHASGTGTLVLLDFLACFGDSPLMTRHLRDVALQASRREERATLSRLILIERPETKIPQGIVGDCEVVHSPLPDVAELLLELDDFANHQDGLDAPRGDEARYALASAVAGLPRHEAARLFARCFIETDGLDATWLRTEKARRVTQRLGGALTFEKTDGAEVGGLGELRRWLGSRKAAFGSAKAREWGLPEPKGLLMVGTPGSGKSLLARSAARELGVPLLRLDAGRLFGSLVGQSEGQTRQAIEAAEACAPCVLWIDEIEKGLAGGAGGGAGDSGTSSRVFGALLSWLQDKTKPVFVVATANRIAALPPELLRKGRFDEIFYVGLPSLQEREDILRIHLKRRGRALSASDVNVIAATTEGYSGAELEQAIVDGLFAAYAEGRELSAPDVRAAIDATQPLSRTMKAEIEAIEAWAKGRARMASLAPVTSAPPVAGSLVVRRR